jgi:hypothetical protein
MSIDRQKLWSTVVRNYEAFRKAAPDGYGAIVEVTLAGRAGPMVVHRVETFGDPELPWSLFSVLSKEDSAEPRAEDARVLVHDDHVQGMSSANGVGVRGLHDGAGIGVLGESGTGVGVAGAADFGVFGQGDGASGIGVIGSGTLLAGYFSGNVHVQGTLTKSAGGFRIDHPLEPKTKYLQHAFVESPDMLNIYVGNVRTDAEGFATVRLPRYFQALNRDFRYQLTVVSGIFAQAIVSREIRANSFQIRTDKPHVKVSWQVTGVRKDAYANAHRIRVEVPKSALDRRLRSTIGRTSARAQRIASVQERQQQAPR